jgi:hypothetical protein
MPERSALIALLIIDRLIIDRPLCLPCIAGRASTTELAAAGYLALMREHLAVLHEDNDRCRACGIVGKVFSLSRMPL